MLPCIEIQDANTSSWFLGSLLKINQTKPASLLVSYQLLDEDNGKVQWRQDEWVPESRVRAKSPHFDPATFLPQVGHLVDAAARNSLTEPYSWWPAKIVDIVQGDNGQQNYMLTFNIVPDNVVEIGKTSIRPINLSSHVNVSSLLVESIILPQNLRGHASVSDFKTLTGGGHGGSGILSITMSNSGDRLTLIGDQLSIKRAVVMGRIMFNHLQEVYALRQQTSSNQGSIERIKSQQHSEEFHVDEKLMGLVIGASGANIQKAQAIKGVMKIHADDGLIRIFAKSKEAVAQARAILEFVEVRYPVPSSQCARIVGTNPRFRHSEDIKRNTGLVRLDVSRTMGQHDWNLPRDWDDDEKSMTNLVLLGTKDACALAKEALDMHVLNVKERVSLQLAEQTTRDELARLTGSLGNRNYGGGNSRNNNSYNRGNKQHYEAEYPSMSSARAGRKKSPEKKKQPQQQQQQQQQQQGKREGNRDSNRKGQGQGRGDGNGKKQGQQQPQQQQQQQQKKEKSGQQQPDKASGRNDRKKQPPVKVDPAKPKEQQGNRNKKKGSDNNPNQQQPKQQESNKAKKNAQQDTSKQTEKKKKNNVSKQDNPPSNKGHKDNVQQQPNNSKKAGKSQEKPPQEQKKKTKAAPKDEKQPVKKEAEKKNGGAKKEPVDKSKQVAEGEKGKTKNQRRNQARKDNAESEKAKDSAKPVVAAPEEGKEKLSNSQIKRRKRKEKQRLERAKADDQKRTKQDQAQGQHKSGDKAQPARKPPADKPAAGESQKKGKSAQKVKEVSSVSQLKAVPQDKKASSPKSVKTQQKKDTKGDAPAAKVDGNLGKPQRAARNKSTKASEPAEQKNKGQPNKGGENSPSKANKKTNVSADKTGGKSSPNEAAETEKKTNEAKQPSGNSAKKKGKSNGKPNTTAVTEKKVPTTTPLTFQQPKDPSLK